MLASADAAPIRRLLLSAFLVASLTSPAWADVTRVTIASRTVVANGQWFGAAGPYEKIAGTVFFELDPADPHNKAIADLDLAPRNARGRVEFSADLFILAPQDPARASGSVLFEISNRGGKGLLTTFNRGTASTDPMQPEHFGDGLLMRNGFTLVWVGWEFDVPGLNVKPPIATKNGSPIVETIAALAVVDARATEVSFSDVPLYPPFDPNDETATLTVRDSVWDRPRRCPAAAGNSPCPTHNGHRPLPRHEMPAHLDGVRLRARTDLRGEIPRLESAGVRRRPGGDSRCRVGDANTATPLPVQRPLSPRLRRLAERPLPSHVSL